MGVVLNHLAEPACHLLPRPRAIDRIHKQSHGTIAVALFQAFGHLLEQGSIGVGTGSRKAGIRQGQAGHLLGHSLSQQQGYMTTARVPHDMHFLIRNMLIQQGLQVLGVLRRTEVAGAGCSGPVGAQAGSQNPILGSKGGDLPAPVAPVAQGAVDQQNRRALSLIHEGVAIALRGQFKRGEVGKRVCHGKQ